MEIDSIRFYINGEEKTTISTNPLGQYYTYLWDKRAFFRKTIKVTGLDEVEDEIASDEITVWIFNI